MVLIYKAQALIYMAECAVTSISIITGGNLVCHKYCVVIWCKNQLRDLFISLTDTLADKDIDALLSDNSSNSQETSVEGWRVCF